MAWAGGTPNWADATPAAIRSAAWRVSGERSPYGRAARGRVADEPATAGAGPGARSWAV